MTEQLDRLMALDPLDLSKQDIDEIIAIHRKARADYEAGVKPKKGGAKEVKIDLVSLGLVTAKEPVKRRI